MQSFAHLGGGQAASGQHDAGGKDAGDEEVDQFLIQCAANDLCNNMAALRNAMRMSMCICRNPQAS